VASSQGSLGDQYTVRIASEEAARTQQGPTEDLVASEMGEKSYTATSPDDQQRFAV